MSLMWLYSFARRLEMCLHDNKHPDNLLLSPPSLSLLLLLLLKIVSITRLLQVSPCWILLTIKITRDSILL